MVNSLKFVDFITASPTTLLDVNDSSAFWLKTFDAPPPRLRRASSSTMLVDGDVVSATAYDPRTVHMAWELLGASDVTGLAIQNLGRQLDMPTNLLRWLPTGATNPVFFRVRRSDYSSIVERHNVNGVRTIEADLLCEPFGVGLRQDLTAVTIANDPLGTNPMNATLGTVKGDVPTPAYIYRTGGAALGVTDLLGVEHAAATTGVPPIDQGEGNTYGTDAAISVVAAASGGNVARVSFATSTNLVSRITGMRLPTTEPGSYRLFARVRQIASVAGVYRIRYFETITGGSNIYGDTVTFTASDSTWFMLDLGLWQFPTGSTLAEDGLTGAPLTRDTDAIGGLQIARDGAATSLDVDYVAAVPAYGDLSFTTGNGTISGTVVWDGYADTQSVVTGTVFSAPTYKTGAIMSREGGLPVLWPGQVNRLWYVSNLGVTGTGHDLTLTTTLNVSYWPRYLYVRPLST